MSGEAAKELGPAAADIAAKVKAEHSDFPVEEIALYLHAQSARRAQAELRIRRWAEANGKDWQWFLAAVRKARQ